MWYRSNGIAKSRIDRILVSPEWLEQWHDCKQYAQVRQVFDHCALVLKTSVIDWGPKPFRVLNVWSTNKRVQEKSEKNVRLIQE